jgi:hypothetical protein
MTRKRTTLGIWLLVSMLLGACGKYGPPRRAERPRAPVQAEQGLPEPSPAEVQEEELEAAEEDVQP